MTSSTRCVRFSAIAAPQTPFPAGITVQAGCPETGRGAELRPGAGKTDPVDAIEQFVENALALASVVTQIGFVEQVRQLLHGFIRVLMHRPLPFRRLVHCAIL
jgi:hypothetical protein